MHVVTAIEFGDFIVINGGYASSSSSTSSSRSISSTSGINNIFPRSASTRFTVMTPPYGASRAHRDTPQSVGFLWTSDQPHAETSS